MNNAKVEEIPLVISKLVAETARINAERRWYPFVVVGGIFAAAFAITKLLA